MYRYFINIMSSSLTSDVIGTTNDTAIFGTLIPLGDVSEDEDEDEDEEDDDDDNEDDDEDAATDLANKPMNRPVQ